MKKIIVAVLVLAVVGGVVWYMKSGKSNTNVSVNSNTGYTMSQVALASGESKCWTVVSGKVYDLTAFTNQHPGGKAKILSICGKDGTAAFTAQHGSQRKPAEELAGLEIGVLKN